MSPDLQKPHARHENTRMRLSILFLTVAIPFAAHAESSYDLASNLGTVLGSETLCGLSFDQAGLSAFIERSVKANDMDFLGTLHYHVKLTAQENKTISDTEKVVKCAQVRRIATFYGFLK